VDRAAGGSLLWDDPAPPSQPARAAAEGLRSRAIHRFPLRADIQTGYNPSTPGGFNVSKSLQEWLQQGEHLYNEALKEYQHIEAQLDQLELQLTAKKAEVNQIASVIGKPPVESNRRLSAQLVDDHGPQSIPHSQATIARALTGRALGR
jgi:hypothetical protein